MAIDQALRYLVADVLGVDIERVVDEASLIDDIGMFCFTEAELANHIEEDYDLNSGWWREDSRTFCDLVRDVKRALAGKRRQEVEDAEVAVTTLPRSERHHSRRMSWLLIKN